MKRFYLKRIFASVCVHCFVECGVTKVLRIFKSANTAYFDVNKSRVMIYVCVSVSLLITETFRYATLAKLCGYLKYREYDSTKGFFLTERWAREIESHALRDRYLFLKFLS